MSATLPWVFDDGGRLAAGYRGWADDCVVRAFAIALASDYAEVYDELAQMNESYHRTGAQRARSSSMQEWHMKHARRSARDGIAKPVIKAFAITHGMQWTPTMAVGQGTRVHLAAGELPQELGPLVVSVSRHVVAIVDGIIRDTFDPSRGGTRAVYGYWARG